MRRLLSCTFGSSNGIRVPPVAPYSLFALSSPSPVHFPSGFRAPDQRIREGAHVARQAGWITFNRVQQHHLTHATRIHRYQPRKQLHLRLEVIFS